MFRYIAKVKKKHVQSTSSANAERAILHERAWTKTLSLFFSKPWLLIKDDNVDNNDHIFLETFAPNTTFFIIWTFSGGQQPTQNVQKAVVVKHWEKAKHQLKRNMKLKRTHWIWPSSRLNFPDLFWISSLSTGCPHFRATKSKSTAQILGSGVFTEISRDA